ncbi:MAG: ATP-binding protein [Myxococcota bacterium]
MVDVPPNELADLLGLIVHDLRNPAATLGANISFFKDAASAPPNEDEDLREAVEDMEAALLDLRRGLDHLGWIARWIGGQEPVQIADGDVVTAVEKAAAQVPAVSTHIEAPVRPLRARGGGTALRLAELLLLNSGTHGQGSEVRLSVWREGEHVVMEMRDGGPAIAEELREVAFDAGGQAQLKGKAGGRYSRAAGLLAVRAIADAMGAYLAAGGVDGDAWFRIRFTAL